MDTMLKFCATYMITLTSQTTTATILK